MSDIKKHYLCLERCHYADGSVGDVETSYGSMKPKIGEKFETVFWFKGYDTAFGYEAYKALCKRIQAYKGKISDEFAKDLAEDVIRNYDDDQAMWDYETKITKIQREIERLPKESRDYGLVCEVMKNIETIVNHQ
jgi:polyhydroxyalkanoate synthesis regulator phasin